MLVLNDLEYHVPEICFGNIHVIGMAKTSVRLEDLTRPVKCVRNVDM